MDFYKIYNPITAMPFRKSTEYVELAPCEALLPYVRCFWGSIVPYQSGGSADLGSENLVTPDTCMDVIFDINHTKESIVSCFCGIDDRSFASEGERERGVVSKFGIRFYAWSAALFSEDALRDVRNARLEAGAHFGGLKKYLEPRLYETDDIFGRAALAEKYLLEHMDAERGNAVLPQAVGFILKRRGVLRIEELSDEMCKSARSLERVFGEYIGMPPKRLSELVRYQYLWNEIIYSPDTDIQDLVYRYGYTDQAHLLRDFKRFHTMTPTEARRYACRNVGFLQDGEGCPC
ncbi:MAG: helix-turn-helix domain-containing protein [Butyrivibrio sp.]|nr:helix-turn-helix domain-containing protein [Butyrivibrio sp.]